MAQVSFKANVGKVRGLQFNNEGGARFSFTAAEGHRGKVNGEWADTGTTWWNVTIFGRDAEAVAELVVEGQKVQVLVTGRSSSREYEKDGVTRSSLDVVADTVGVVPRPQAVAQGQSQPAQGNQWNGSQEASPF